MDAPPIYLDHMASTPLDEEVRAAMLDWLDPAMAGNPHSAHGAGWRAAKAVDRARAQVAGLIGAEPERVFFTSGATEANNLALFGLKDAFEHLIVSAIEHPAVLEPAVELSGEDKRLTVLKPDGAGRIDLGALESALGEGPALVSIMMANNEIGALQPVGEIGALCRAHGALFHTDATQAASSRPIDVGADKIDLLSLSGHKMYGPGGIGELYAREGVPLEPLVFGGGQQAGLRPGTVPVALSVGLGAAAAVARRRRAEDSAHMATLRDRLIAGLGRLRPDIRINSRPDGLPGCLSVTIPGIDAADLLLGVPGLAASTGSACSSIKSSPSHVLRAIGLTAEEAHATLRFGLGRHTTAQEIDEALRLLSDALDEQRAAAPAAERLKA